MATNAIIFEFSPIYKKDAQCYVNNYKCATQEVIDKVFPNDLLHGKEKGDNQFYSTAFLMDDKRIDNNEQEHLQGMLRESGRINIVVNGDKPIDPFDSYRFYVGIDNEEKAVCILAYALRYADKNGKSLRYVDVPTHYYYCNCEINEPDEKDVHELNHLSCKPHCEGTSL